MIFAVAVTESARHFFIAALLVVSPIINGADGTSPGTFQTRNPLPVKTPGMDIPGPHPVWSQLQVYHKAGKAVGHTLFRNKEILHAESPQACGIGYVAV
jgi:hypothetical protein